MPAETSSKGKYGLVCPLKRARGIKMSSVKFKHRSVGSRCFDIVLYILLGLVVLVTFYPMYYVFIVSISSANHISRGEVTLLPMGINFDAYKIVFKNSRIWVAYGNTILYTVVGTFINVMMTALCAYPFSRPDFYGRKFFTLFVTLTMFIGGGMIPLYLVVSKLHLMNTIWAIVLPGAVSTYNMIVMRTSFQGLPASLTESAYIDGANDIHILFRIVLPLSKAILATMTLFYAVGHWNSYLSAILYLDDQKKYPVQVILRDIVIAGEFMENGGDVSSSATVIATNYKYAVIIVSVLPILMVYPFIQKYFTKGIMVGSIKG